ncbi:MULTISPECIES: hypothetical protein [unclassified Micromonospora]|uniref:hypothetical protein n=1 Tax=unclassified Micromonospora TaxID=2617518 RepID=UPI0033295CCF
MNLIDCNAMLGRLPTANAGEGSAAALVKLMDRFGIDGAVVAHTAAWRHDPASGNALLLAELAGEPRLRPAWVGLPDSCGEVAPPTQFVVAARRQGVVAVRLYPADHGYALGGPDCAPLLDALAAARLPLLIDAAQAPMAEIEAVAAARPALPVVVCQLGYRALRQLAGVLARTGNVHLDLSYLGSHLGLEWLVERFGCGRLLFGTGLPLRDPADAVTRLLWSELDGGAVGAIGGGNLRRLIGGELW